MSKVTGEVIHLGETEVKSDKFKLKLVVIKTDDKYPQEIPVQYVNEKISDSYNLEIGDMVTIEYNLRGRKWNDRWNVSLNAWKTEKH